jgi:hypothetical protein
MVDAFFFLPTFFTMFQCTGVKTRKKPPEFGSLVLRLPTSCHESNPKRASSLDKEQQLLLPVSSYFSSYC